jgi:hypothetical protein
LSQGRPDVYGAATSRAEAQVLRLSAIYAALDCSPLVEACHLQAALAVWDYCLASARLFFDTLPSIPPPSASARPSTLPGRIDQNPNQGLFHGHVSKERIDLALEQLLWRIGRLRRTLPGGLWHLSGDKRPKTSPVQQQLQASVAARLAIAGQIARSSWWIRERNESKMNAKPFPSENRPDLFLGVLGNLDRFFSRIGKGNNSTPDAHQLRHIVECREITQQHRRCSSHPGSRCVRNAGHRREKRPGRRLWRRRPSALPLIGTWRTA